MKFTAHEFVKGDRLIKADAHAVSTINGVGIDTREFRELLATLIIDDVGGGPGTVAFKLQESSDNGVADAFVDIVGAAMTVKNAVGVFVGRLDLQLRERFIRAVITVAVNAVDCAAIASLIHGRNLPVAQVVATEFNIGTDA